METVIQEIANQLGMAVDQAGQLITDQLPNFAALQCVKNIIPLIVVCVLFIVSLAVSIVSIIICNKKHAQDMKKYEIEVKDHEKKVEERGKRIESYKNISGMDEFINIVRQMPYILFPREPKKYDNHSYEVSIASIIAAAIFLVMFLVMACFSVPNVIGWQNYPEAMLIDMALKAVG